MAKGDRVADTEQVVLYAKPSAIDGGIVTSVAFERRPIVDDDGLSVCRLGLLCNEAESDLAQVRSLMSARLKSKKLSKNGALVELSVADIVAAGEELAHELFVTEDPLDEDEGGPANPAHALIIGLPFAGTEIGELSAVRAGDKLARKHKALHPTV